MPIVNTGVIFFFFYFNFTNSQIDFKFYTQVQSTLTYKTGFSFTQPLKKWGSLFLGVGADDTAIFKTYSIELF